VGGGSVSSEGTPTNASGLAQVSRTLGLTPGAYSTTAEVSGLTGSPVTFTSTATVGPPARLAMLIQPGTPTTSGSAFNPAPAVQVQDAQGNPVAQGGIPINVDILAGSGQPGATLENDQPRNTNGGGRSTFTGLRITGPPDDDYVLVFSAQVGGNPLTPVSSAPISVTAGAATRLVIQTQPPGSVVTGTVLSPAPVVQVVDGAGNPVAGARNIQVTLGSGPGALSGTTSVNTGAGSTATFSNLTITGPGTHTLLFSSSGLTSAESGDIVVTAEPPASIEKVDGDGQTATVNEAVATDPSVRVRNAGGDPLEGVTVTFQVTQGDGVVTPTTVITGSDGLATVTSWTMGPTAGTNTMTATVSGLAPVTFNATADEASTTTGLVAEPDPGTANTLVTLTATVSSPSQSPTGQVSFSAGGTQIGDPVTLVPVPVTTTSVAILTVTAGFPATTELTANYPGNSSFAPSSDNLTYTVASANVVPNAQSDAFTVNEDETLAIGPPGVLGNDTDADNDDLTSQQVSPPANASNFALNADGSFTYTPQNDFNDNDSFTYLANDGQANSNVATVTITVTPVDDPPSFTTQGNVSTSSIISSVLGQTHDGWVTGIDPGPPDEDGQTVQFQVSVDNEAAFQDLPQIDASGNLAYRPQLTLTPIAVIASVVAQDSGGATSSPQSFTITINP
jgi:adhesin/invasin